MRALGVLLLCSTILGGCGLAHQREMQEKIAAVTAQVKADVEVCNVTYPREAQNTAVARAKCMTTAAAPLRPLSTYPDLFDQESAARMALAEQRQAGKLTQAEYEAQFTQMHSRMVSEDQQRRLATRSVGAQESAAAAAWAGTGPVICNKVGSTTICN